MKAVIRIENEGPMIASTNFFASKQAQDGIFLLSFNAGAARLLIPPIMEPLIDEMKSGKMVVISRGPKNVVELMFDDDSDYPFTIHIGPEQVDRIWPLSDVGKEIRFLGITLGPQVAFERPAVFRVMK